MGKNPLLLDSVPLPSITLNSFFCLDQGEVSRPERWKQLGCFEIRVLRWKCGQNVKLRGMSFFGNHTPTWSFTWLSHLILTIILRNR